MTGCISQCTFIHVSYEENVACCQVFSLRENGKHNFSWRQIGAWEETIIRYTLLKKSKNIWISKSNCIIQLFNNTKNIDNNKNKLWHSV